MALSELTTPEQLALALRYGQGLSIEETAQVMGRSRQSIKGLCHRARARLTGLLADESPPLPTRVAGQPRLRDRKRNEEL
jgi:DNA-directed RNA polymerase specialized sigma24 family protein